MQEQPKTRIVFDDRARAKIAAGIDEVADAVKVTLGPLGRNVGIDRNGQGPRITHDGITVAAAVDPSDIFAQIATRLAKHAAKRTNASAGDGTSTTIVLVQALLTEGFRLIAAGAEPMSLRRELEAAADMVDAALVALSTPATDEAIFARIATVAAGDPEIGRILGEAMAWCGEDGTIAISEGRRSFDEVNRTEGYVFDRGYLSSVFLTHPERDEAVLLDPGILLTDQKIESAHDLVPILEQLLKAGKKEIVVVASDFSPDALGLLVQNTVNGTIRALAVKAPEFAERRTAALDDLALVTGATLLSAEGGYRLRDATPTELGRAWQVISRSGRTAVVGGRGDPARVRTRVNQIAGELAVETVKFNREKLEARLVRLGNRVVEIAVGAPTGVEINERKMRFDDAHQALTAAAREGIVPGGGIALLSAAACLDHEESTGAAILRRALVRPIDQLVENAGGHGPVVVAELRRRQDESGNPLIGYDVESGRYIDVREVGLVDSAPVVRAALRHAVSVAALLLTCGVVVAHVPIDEAERRRKQRKPTPGLAAGHGPTVI